MRNVSVLSLAVLVVCVSVFQLESQAQTPYSIEAIGKAGDPAPGTGGGTFAEIPRPTHFTATVQTAQRRVAFVATIAGGSVDSGIFVRESDGTVRAVVVADSAGVNGMPLPGFAGAWDVGVPCAGCAGRATRLGGPAMDDRGRVAFIARVAGGNVDKGLYVAEPDGTLKIVALASFNLNDRTTSTPVPDSGGATIQDFHFQRLFRGFDDPAEPSINRNGEVAFYAISDRPTEFFAEVVLVGRFPEDAEDEGGSIVATLRKAAMTGDPAPDPGDAPIGAIINWPVVSLNSHGDVAFDEFPSFPSSLVDRRLFMADAGGNLTRLAQTGDAVVFPENATFGGFSFSPQINDECEEENNASTAARRACVAAFSASVQHPDVTGGIFLRQTDGTSRAVVLEDRDGADGSPVPGTSHTFDQLHNPASLTNEGRFAFKGVFENGCTEGIFAWLGSEVATIAKEGNAVPGFSLPLFRFGIPFLGRNNKVAFTAQLAQKFAGDCFADGSFVAAASSRELSWSTVNNPQVQVGLVDLRNGDQIFAALPNLPVLASFLESVVPVVPRENTPAGSEFTWTLTTDSGSIIQLKFVSLGLAPDGFRRRFELRLLVNAEVLASRIIVGFRSPIVILMVKEIVGTNHLLGGDFDVTGQAVDALAGDTLVEISYGVTGPALTRYQLEQIILSTDPISPAVFLATEAKKKK